MNNEPIVMERTYEAPAAKIWQALTDPEQMKQWYFDIPGFKPEVGFEFQFEGGDGNQTFVHQCRVTEAVPNQKLSHTWRYEGFPGESLVTFELFEEGDKTRLKLTHAGLETFPSENPAFAKANFVAGWTEITGKMLKEFVEKTSVQNA